ncbi:MAG: IS1 family transposase [Proteobacteria bacterium]|nr:IS1 family transposase [Pseudomonadota bacterium]
MAFYRVKKNKLWVIKAIDRASGKTIAWVTGGRDTQTVKELYEKIKHCTKAIFYTDNWDAFAKVLPKNRHVIGKKHTVSIERNNSNTRYYLGRFNRKTKIVSKSEYMVNLSLKLWWYICEQNHFTELIHSFQSYLN